jgi:hypothetical protein
MPGVLAVGLLLISSPAHAQSAPAGPYVFGGWSLQLREGTGLNGVTFGGGLPLTTTLSAEGSVGWYATFSADYSYNTPFGQFETHITDRDVPVVGAVRWSLPCGGRVCADVVGGAGVNVYQLKTRILKTCPPPGLLGPCIQTDAETDDHRSQFLLLGGIDLGIRLIDHLSVGPGFRLAARKGELPAIPRFRNTDAPYYLVNVTARYRF